MADIHPFRKVGEVASGVVRNLERGLLYGARDGYVCRLDSRGGIVEALDLRAAISLHADWTQRAKRLRFAGTSEAAKHSQDIADEIADAITEARRPPHTFEMRAVKAMSDFPLDPNTHLDDAHPIAIKVGADLVRCTVGDIREAKRLKPETVQ